MSSKLLTIISLNTINKLIFVVEKYCVLRYGMNF
jgi:hypothetical protein